MCVAYFGKIRCLDGTPAPTSWLKMGSMGLERGLPCNEAEGLE